MTNYKVKITCMDLGLVNTVCFTKECQDLDELKQAFLKRFGNIHNVSNARLKEKPIVKRLTHKANSLGEWLDDVNSKTQWVLSISIA